MLGATGRLGGEILQQLIKENITVNVLVRKPDNLGVISEKVSVFKGDPFDQNALNGAMVECNSIITCLNISRRSDFPWSKLRTPKKLLSQTMQQLLHLMPKYGISRIITVSAWGTNETKKELPGWFRWLIYNSNIRYGYLDHERQEDLLTSTDLKWTIVRPVGLNNSNKDKPIQSVLNEKPKHVMVSRSNVAQFVVEALLNGRFIQKKPTVF